MSTKDDMAALTWIAYRDTRIGVSFPSETPRLFTLALHLLQSSDGSSCLDVASAARDLAQLDTRAQAAAVLLRDAMKQYHPTIAVTTEECHKAVLQFVMKEDTLKDMMLRLVMLHVGTSEDKLCPVCRGSGKVEEESVGLWGNTAVDVLPCPECRS